MKETGTASKTNAGSPKQLYRIGAIAALIAGLVFRRNLGAAEIPLFIGQNPPDTVVGWFSLFQESPLLGLSFLNVFDLINYALVGVMFGALFAAFQRTSKKCMGIAMVLGLVGIFVYCVSNKAFAILSLSNQYASSTTEAQKATLLAAGQALLSNGCNSNSAYSSGGSI